ncbi:mRNA interferase MazF [Thermosporothrix hazakensis]|jgi:mRNA interferase MazF|uniref:mRNA interferase n=2 Tax=Thermosporothrix TaxID=768650 RepID=A0A326TVG2_THEHA|nr:type II toxin-antitoxin system PemK/MazF family toxin [Thermosporothrix hazakensis]PZW19394.1 mRNA interferase MazF [Thermosporothrix hazakensis]BBH89864.1 endoribonuclease MazF9 [Thermosporothrix sp. COM3]GCE48060.1 endoribonuclease MazF9 [Thermosporothrix hazakensis]
MSDEARHAKASPKHEAHGDIPFPQRGEIWDVNWSPGRGAEQQGTRPALIIQNDRGNASRNYPLTIVASMSRTERELPLHVRIAPSKENGLTDYTDVKCEQLMTIEKSRLLKRRGVITPEELHRVDLALKISLNLS